MYIYLFGQGLRGQASWYSEIIFKHLNYFLKYKKEASAIRANALKEVLIYG